MLYHLYIIVNVLIYMILIFMTGLIIYFGFWEALPFFMIFWMVIIASDIYTVRSIVKVDDEGDNIILTRFNGKVITVNKARIKERKRILGHLLIKIDDGRILYMSCIVKVSMKRGEELQEFLLWIYRLFKQNVKKG